MSDPDQQQPQEQELLRKMVGQSRRRTRAFRAKMRRLEKRRLKEVREQLKAAEKGQRLAQQRAEAAAKQRVAEAKAMLRANTGDRRAAEVLFLQRQREAQEVLRLGQDLRRLQRLQRQQLGDITSRRRSDQVGVEAPSATTAPARSAGTEADSDDVVLSDIFLEGAEADTAVASSRREAERERRRAEHEAKRAEEAERVAEQQRARAEQAARRLAEREERDRRRAEQLLGQRQRRRLWRSRPATEDSTAPVAHSSDRAEDTDVAVGPAPVAEPDVQLLPGHGVTAASDAIAEPSGATGEETKLLAAYPPLAGTGTTADPERATAESQQAGPIHQETAPVIEGGQRIVAERIVAASADGHAAADNAVPGSGMVSTADGAVPVASDAAAKLATHTETPLAPATVEQNVATSSDPLNLTPDPQLEVTTPSTSTPSINVVDVHVQRSDAEVGGESGDRSADVAEPTLTSDAVAAAEHVSGAEGGVALSGQDAQPGDSDHEPTLRNDEHSGSADSTGSPGHSTVAVQPSRPLPPGSLGDLSEEEDAASEDRSNARRLRKAERTAEIARRQAERDRARAEAAEKLLARSARTNEHGAPKRSLLDRLLRRRKPVPAAPHDVQPQPAQDPSSTQRPYGDISSSTLGAQYGTRIDDAPAADRIQGQHTAGIVDGTDGADDAVQERTDGYGTDAETAEARRRADRERRRADRETARAEQAELRAERERVRADEAAQRLAAREQRDRRRAEQLLERRARGDKRGFFARLRPAQAADAPVVDEDTSGLRTKDATGAHQASLGDKVGSDTETSSDEQSMPGVSAPMLGVEQLGQDTASETPPAAPPHAAPPVARDLGTDGDNVHRDGVSPVMADTGAEAELTSGAGSSSADSRAEPTGQGNDSTVLSDVEYDTLAEQQHDWRVTPEPDTHAHTGIAAPDEVVPEPGPHSSRRPRRQRPRSETNDSAASTEAPTGDAAARIGELFEVRDGEYEDGDYVDGEYEDGDYVDGGYEDAYDNDGYDDATASGAGTAGVPTGLDARTDHARSSGPRRRARLTRGAASRSSTAKPATGPDGLEQLTDDEVISLLSAVPSTHVERLRGWINALPIDAQRRLLPGDLVVAASLLGFGDFTLDESALTDLVEEVSVRPLLSAAYTAAVVEYVELDTAHDDTQHVDGDLGFLDNDTPSRGEDRAAKLAAAAEKARVAAERREQRLKARAERLASRERARLEAAQQKALAQQMRKDLHDARKADRAEAKSSRALKREQRRSENRRRRDARADELLGGWRERTRQRREQREAAAQARKALRATQRAVESIEAAPLPEPKRLRRSRSDAILTPEALAEQTEKAQRRAEARTRKAQQRALLDSARREKREARRAAKTEKLDEKLARRVERDEARTVKKRERDRVSAQRKVLEESVGDLRAQRRGLRRLEKETRALERVERRRLRRREREDIRAQRAALRAADRDMERASRVERERRAKTKDRSTDRQLAKLQLRAQQAIVDPSTLIEQPVLAQSSGERVLVANSGPAPFDLPEPLPRRTR